MPIWWPLKVPERGNAITQRKTLEIKTTAKHVCLYFIRRTTQPGHYRFFLIPKKILAKFSYQKKSWNRKFQTPKILRSSPSLEIPSTPLPPGHLTRPIILQICKMADYNLLLVAIPEDTRKSEPINQKNKLKTLL